MKLSFIVNSGFNRDSTSVFGFSYCYCFVFICISCRRIKNDDDTWAKAFFIHLHNSRIHCCLFSPPASKYTFQKRSTVILCYSSVLGGLFKQIRMNKHTESVWAMQTKKRCMEKFIILIVIIQKIHSFDFRVHLFVSDIPTRSLTNKIHRSRKKKKGFKREEITSNTQKMV